MSFNKKQQLHTVKALINKARNASGEVFHLLIILMQPFTQPLENK